MDEAVIKRIMPHSVEAEQSVIGAMLYDEAAVQTAVEILTGDDFYQRQYGLVFEAMASLFAERKAVDVITVQNRLREMDAPPEISDMEFVTYLMDLVPTSANIKHYANIVKDKSVLRQLIRVNEEVENSCYLGNESADEIMDASEKKLFELFQKRNTTDFVPIDRVVMEALERIETAAKTKGSVTGLSTGFYDLDQKTAGFQKSDLILVAARPSMGKTAFALNIAQYMTLRQNKTVAIFSLEMSKQQLMNRLFAMETKIDSQDIRSGNLRDDDWTNLIDRATAISRSKLIIDDTGDITVREMRSKCRKYKLEQGLDMIIIDYLQMMREDGRRDSNRQQEISDISRGLKALARELDVPVVALSQLSRAVEQRAAGDHRPILSDLRESGAIEQDADIVLFLYRDDYYHQDSEKKGVTEVIIAKQRNGPIGTIELSWIPKYTRFENFERKR